MLPLCAYEYFLYSPRSNGEWHVRVMQKKKTVSMRADARIMTRGLRQVRLLAEQPRIRSHTS